MRRTSKVCRLKSAFTLLEMVLVVAVIIILASVLIIGVTQFFNAANNASNEVANESSALESNIDKSERYLQDFNF